MKGALSQVLISLLIVSETSCKRSTRQLGDRQSPIDIHTKDEVPIRNEGEARFAFNYDYNSGSTVEVFKDEHSVKLVPEKISKDFSVSYAEEVYAFAELHFHWGLTDSEGCEHTLNKKRYSMEAHLVHFKLEYGSKAKAMQKEDGFIVVGLFLQAGGADNSLFESVTKIVTQAQASDDKFKTTAKEAYNWLKETFKKPMKYYTYLGSLTTPPYTENVRWFVYDSKFQISSAQVAPFRTLKHGDKDLTPNFRDVQPLNGRVIYTARSHGNVAGPSKFMVFSSILLGIALLPSHMHYLLVDILGLYSCFLLIIQAILRYNKLVACKG